MDIKAFKTLIDLKLSVATNKPKADGTPESYIGYLLEIGSDYIVLDCGRASIVKGYPLDKVFLLASSVVGVWVYKE